MNEALRVAAEAATILTERREKDGLVALIFGDPGPFVHQALLWGSKKSQAWLFGANRSGKTEALAAIGSSFLRFGNPDPRPSICGDGIVLYDRSIRLWGISLTYDMSRNILQAKMFNNGAGLGGRHPLIPDSEIASWNVTNQTIRLKNGNIGIFKTGESGRDSFMGADIDIALFDEVPPEDIHTEVTMRVGGGRRLLIRGAATILPPPGVPGGISWMFTSKVAPWLELGANANQRNGKSPNLDIFTASIYDNPTIISEELRRMEALYAPGSPEYLIRMKGELVPSIGGALVYQGFSRAYHVNAALAPKIDGRPTPHVNPLLPLVLSVDFNPADGVWLVGQKISGVFRVVDEIFLERSDIPSMCAEFRSRFPAHQAELHIYGDSTGRRPETQTGESNYHLIQQFLSGYPVPIRYNLPALNPPVPDRVSAVNLQLRSPTGIRHIEIAPHCTQTIEDLETTKWKANGKIDKRGKFQSNGADCLGYWISYDCPTVRFGAVNSGLKTVRSPSYTPSTRAFPATVRPLTQGLKSVGRAFMARSPS